LINKHGYFVANNYFINKKMNLKSIPFLIISMLLLFQSCNKKADNEELINSVFQTEKAFEKMAADSGIAIAFRNFADENGVILRAKDSIIVGKKNIYEYYNTENTKNATVNWTPDKIEVSDDGTLAYTYGKYTWKIRHSNDSITIQKGIFHTVWKRQPDKKWKYVWD